jgi:hypothetical protein
MKISKPKAPRQVLERTEGVSHPGQASEAEALKTWKTIVSAAWSLSNLRSGLVDVAPRLKGLPEALNLLKESVPAIQRASTLDTLEGEVQSGAAELKAFSEDLMGVRGLLEEVLQAIWRRRSALKSP